MKKTASAVTISAVTISVLLLSACASQPRGTGVNGPIRFVKNPSVVLALDIAQNREAQEKDAYTALRDTASEDALLFVPEPVMAKPWLKAQPPLKNTKWQPHEVILSCDGKTGVTTGAIQWGNVQGYYTTVWQFFERRDGKGGGEWRWVLSHGAMLEKPRIAPEFLATRSASCKGRAPASLTAPAEGVQMKQGFSIDQSLSYGWQYRPDRSRVLTVNIWDGEKTVPVLTNEVAAPES